MTDYTGINIAWGAAGRVWDSDELAAQILQVFKENDVRDLDVTPGLGNTEANVGSRGASSEFNIGTKWSGGFTNTPATLENISRSLNTSLQRLKTEQVDIFYMHAPARTTPIVETLSAINELYKAGHFRRFGLSNYLPEEVEEVVRVATENGFVLPSVYQGNYSAVARKQEEKLFPILRKNNIAFYAYSPIAGGFLTKTRAEIEAADAPRWDPNSYLGMIYTTLYKKPAFLEALSKWDTISTESGIPKAELAYRWVAHNSPLKREHGDALIFGARSVDQARQTIEGVKKGPLPELVARQVDEIWALVKDEAGLDNFNLNKS